MRSKTVRLNHMPSNLRPSTAPLSGGPLSGASRWIGFPGFRLTNGLLPPRSATRTPQLARYRYRPWVSRAAAASATIFSIKTSMNSRCCAAG